MTRPELHLPSPPFLCSRKTDASKTSSSKGVIHLVSEFVAPSFNTQFHDRWRFFACQCRASALVAFESHSRSSALAVTSIAAKYFGAFCAGLPSGCKSFADTSGAMS